jgi:Zn-dependent membrane protease YugP
LLIGIVLFSLTTLFSLITLPVEFDASSRALSWLDTSGIVRKDEHDLSKDSLRWAASTYVVAAIASIATLLYYLQIYAGRRD